MFEGRNHGERKLEVGANLVWRYNSKLGLPPVFVDGANVISKYNSYCGIPPVFVSVSIKLDNKS